MTVKITRSFDPMTDRYAFDFGPCTYANGFAQIDTEQDASYFGTWVSPSRRMIVSYCEGDVTVTEAETDAELAAELESINAWNTEHRGQPARIDSGCDPALIEAFRTIGVGHLLH